MNSLQAIAIKSFARLFFRYYPKNPEDMLRHCRRSFNHLPVPNLLPAEIQTESFLVRKSGRSLRGEFLKTEHPDFYILYLHGGAYVAGRSFTYINMVGKICADILANAWLLDYRLAPEHRYPAALEDAVTAYQYLLDAGLPPEKIIVMGDSAGGGLTLALLLYLRDHGQALPRCAVALSPYTDLTLSSPSVTQNSESDDILTAGFLFKGRELYTNPENFTNPYVSPVFGDYHDLPPLCLAVSNTECLRDDSLRVKEKAESAGVRVRLLVREDLPHVWPVYHPVMPEATEDLGIIADFIAGLT